MSRNHERKAIDATRRNKRSSAPALSPLEDRRLMTRGFAAAMMAEPAGFGGGAAPGFAGAPQALVATHAVAATTPASDVKLSFEGDYTTLPAPGAFPGSTGDEWVFSGSDAQFGPMGYLALSPSGQTWPTTSFGSTADASETQAALDAAFAKQSTDMQAIQDKSEVTPKLLASLRAARATVAGEAGEADATLAATFQADVQAVQQSGTFTDEQATKIKDGYTAVLKSAGVTDAAISGLYAAQDAVKAASKLTSDDVKLLSDDQAAIQTLLDAMPKTDAPFMAMDGGATPIAARAELGGVYMNMAPGAPGAAGGEAGTVAVTSLPYGGATSADPATLAATSGLAPGDAPVSITSADGAEGTPILYSTADQPVAVTTTSAGGAVVPISAPARPTTPSAPAGYYQEGGLQPVSLGNFGRRVSARSGAARVIRSLNGVPTTVGNTGGTRTPTQVVTAQPQTGQPIAQSLGALGRRAMGMRSIRSNARIGF